MDKFDMKFEVQQVVQAEMKRRNAVQEIIKVYSHVTYPVQFNPAQLSNNIPLIYKTALSYVLNGDLQGAVKFLSSQGKHRMASIVSQALNSNYGKELVKNMLEHDAGVRQFNVSYH